MCAFIPAPPYLRFVDQNCRYQVIFVEKATTRAPRPWHPGRMINVCVAGATGWTGSAVAAAIVEAADLALTSAIARSAAGSDLGSAWGRDPIGVPVHGTVEDALEGVEVLVDYTSHATAKAFTLAAVARGIHVVIGSSGLTADDFAEIEAAATDKNVGVVASGNFSVTAAMAQAAALLAARYLPQWEIVDFASAGKPDVPSGTAREMAERLGEVRRPLLGRPLGEIAGPVEARGATVSGVQVHSVRLPSFSASTEVVFAQPDERLTIRHDAGSSAAPYVAGTLMAVRAVGTRPGLTRGLDTLLLDGG